jgi:hypothetical protein
VLLPNAVRMLTLAGALAASLFALAPPRVLWQNAGPSIEYPRTAGTGALVGALALAGLGLSGSRRPWRGLAFVAAGLMGLCSGHLLAYRFGATERGLSQRGLLGSTSLGWEEITRVELEARHVAVYGPTALLRIPSARISPEDRARLERTISRRVRELAGRRSEPGNP